MTNGEKTRDELLSELASLRAEVESLRTSHAPFALAGQSAAGKHVAIKAHAPHYDAAAHARRIRQVRKIEEDLYASEDRFRAIFEQAAVGISQVRLDGRWAQVNQRFCDIVGYTHEELQALTFQKITHPEDLDADLACLRQLLDGEIATCSMEKRYIHKSGAPVWVHLTVSLVRSRPLGIRRKSSWLGEPQYFIGVIEDISARKELEHQKNEFLGVVSHELKTPLTTLKMLAQLTRRRMERMGVLDVDHGARMERAVERMERLVNDLLDVSRIESGRLALDMERCDLVEVCRTAAAEQMDVTEREIILLLPEDHVQVNADPDRISQVLANLLSNALKYSAGDRPVMLSLRRERREVVVSVHDEGGGIPEDLLPHLFDRFYRVPGVQVQSGSGVGLGLGLYISKDIVEQHGGRIWAKGSIGAGSTFSFSLPL
ncbi:MAG TPA: ATP-binding protein [Ktedonobacterales bacterium]